MKNKKYLTTLLGSTAIFFTFTSSNIVSAADTNSSPAPTLSVAPNNEGNYISLNWNKPDASKDYSYMIYSKKSTDTLFQSIPAKSNVKVLNIYPSAGNNLKTWMETNGYGKGLISVDQVTTDTFNSNPTSYLKDSNGNWKYDVIYEGAWDSNNSKDLSANAEQGVEAFIKSGRGYLAGHDTFYSYAVNRNKLSNYLNLIPNVSQWFGNTSVILNKKGLLTNYPWEIGDVGTKLTVPVSHSTGQYAFGDVWIKYNGNTVYGYPETTSYNGKPATNNFYLTTWNNTAMIQTGHSNGAATTDEQKVLANTIFYLNQVTDDTNWDDHKGQDLTAPTKPTISKVTPDTSGNKTTINLNGADNGTTYEYYVEAKDTATGEKVNSDTKTATITTGIKGYSVIVDQKPDTTPPNQITTQSNTCSVSGAYSDDFYVHVAAIDNAGNVSEPLHYHYTYPSLSLTRSEATSDPSNPVTITASASSSDSDIQKIQTPDGNWVNGSTATYSADVNGTYNFTAVDTDGHQITKSITITGIVPKVVLSVEPEKNNINLNENLSAYLTIDNIKDIAAEDIRIKYDNTKLQFLGYEQVDGIMLAKTSSKDNELRFVLASKGVNNIVNSKKSLLKLNFKGITAGDAYIDVTSGIVSDGIKMKKTLVAEQCGQTAITISNSESINTFATNDFLLPNKLAINKNYYSENTMPISKSNVDNDYASIISRLIF